MHPNQKIILDFYQAFDRCDGELMTSFYQDDIMFDASVFPEFRGEKAQVSKLNAFMAKKHDKPKPSLVKVKLPYSHRLKVYSGRYDYQFTSNPSNYRKPVPWIQLKGY